MRSRTERPEAAEHRRECVEQGVDVLVRRAPAHADPQRVVCVDAHGLEDRATARGPRTRRRCPSARRCRPGRARAGRPGVRCPRMPRHTMWGSRSCASPNTSTSSSAVAAARTRAVRRRAARSSSSSPPARMPAAAPHPTMAGTFSNPARRARSWSPPTSRASRRRPRRTSRAPTPGGPPILCALTLMRSASSDRKSTGTWPAACAASTCTSTPRSRQPATTSATGCVVPTSWLPHWRWTSAVSGRTAAEQLVGVDAALAIAADEAQVVPGRAEAHRGMLDRRRDHVDPAIWRALLGSRRRSVDRRGDGLGGAAREHHLAAPGSEQRGHAARAPPRPPPGRPGLRGGCGPDPRRPRAGTLTMASTASGRVGEVDAWSR